MCVIVKRPDVTNTLQLQDTLDEVVDRLMPLEFTDLQCHEEMRAGMDAFTGDYLRVTETTEDDLTAAVAKISQYMSPGPDSVHGKIIELSYPNFQNSMLRLYQACLRLKYFPSA